MPLVRLQDGPSPWMDIKEAAFLLWQASMIPDINALRTTLQTHYNNPSLLAQDLHTGINANRKAVSICNGQNITIALQGSENHELIMNTWSDGKGAGWWELPYAVYDNGNRVHNYYRDMWHGMRQSTYAALATAVQHMATLGTYPLQLTITGFSMGGGVSILAFTDLIQHIRHTYGSASPEPLPWALDTNFHSLIQHLTFAAVAAADQGYYTHLNNLYDAHQIRAWDFMHYGDWSLHMHHGAFRSWRGHRYMLPEAVVRWFGAEFGPQAHFILGYFKAAEWMAGNDGPYPVQIQSAYSY